MPPLSALLEVIAHRGASAHAPENTLASFALARRLGADCIELDVRATSDGVPVVLHDPTLERTAGVPWAIAETPVAELASLPEEVRPPTLAEVFDAFGTTTDYLVEIKRIPVEAEAALVSEIARRRLRPSLTVQSFDHLLLRRLRRRSSGLALAALFRPGADVVAGLNLVAPFVGGIGPCADVVDSRLVGAAHARGLSVRTWTVNDTDEMQRLLEAGVDGVITDRPERARAVAGAAARRLQRGAPRTEEPLPSVPALTAMTATSPG